MPNPSHYNPSYSFTGYQDTNPSKPLPAPPLDNELANISIAINDTQDALAQIRRPDGTVNNGIVTFNSLDQPTQNLINTAVSDSSAALTAANSAVGTANTANANASAAVVTANNAVTVADGAKATADHAVAIAEAAAGGPFDTNLITNVSTVPGVTTTDALNNLKATDATKAPLNGPTFTGVVSVPDVTAGDSSAKAVNSKFVATAVANKPSLIVSDTPPPTPIDSSMWWESDTGYLFLRYNDGNSTQWVQLNGIPAAVTAGYVAKTGDTMTGNLSLTGSAGSARSILGATGPNKRWEMQLAGPAAESGGNAGSNFNLLAYDDSGAALSTPLSVNRASGAATMTGGLTITKPWAAVGDDALVLAPSAGAASMVMQFPAGTGASITSKNGANVRWSMALGSGAESSGNVGSNFALSRYSDAGALIDTPLTITRSNGVCSFSSQIIVRPGPGTVGALFTMADSGGVAKANCYWNTSSGIVYLTSIAAGSNFNLGAAGDVNAVPAAGHNFVVSPGAGFQTGGGPWTALSDARIKTVTSDYSQGLDAILALRPVNYVYKGNDSFTADEPSMHAHATEQSLIGLVAQEAEIPMPEMVGRMAGFIDGEPVSDLRNLNTGPLVFALVNAVKELAAKNTALEARIATLEATP